MSNTLEAPEGVRLGNEKLVLVTAAAGTKLSSLIERAVAEDRQHGDGDKE